MALASIGPPTAMTTPCVAWTEIDKAKASPELQAAIAALNESFDRLEAAQAVFKADDLKMVEWSENNPRPKKGRALKKYWRKWREMRDSTAGVSWEAQIEAETDFRIAQVAVAHVVPRDRHDLLVKAATSVVYDRVKMEAYGSTAIIGLRSRTT